ncbi:hypothetical protein Ae406Ps2_2808 [Pseudonocardia sp. Ae406_Ps2]|nr:hypothetical protein Ae331Ps2_3117c [Pseudonocardia sp. Ae331_Ps2]OLM02808.1 hypothetical protein Ae406Ps2_2808 [Pseudonocardia sp. Ae406_Ps2]OLM24387.1 hypothetical protein Ae706Ps2_2820 [Pseudonocardia sp. Ae706_Ps2]
MSLVRTAQHRPAVRREDRHERAAPPYPSRRAPPAAGRGRPRGHPVRDRGRRARLRRHGLFRSLDRGRMSLIPPGGRRDAGSPQPGVTRSAEW